MQAAGEGRKGKEEGRNRYASRGTVQRQGAGVGDVWSGVIAEAEAGDASRGSEAYLHQREAGEGAGRAGAGRVVREVAAACQPFVLSS